MLQLLKTHKKPVAIVCAAVLLCSFLAAIYVTRQMKAAEQEQVPPGRTYDAGKLGENIIVHDSA